MAVPHQAELAAFLNEQGFRGKGELCVALVVTQHAKSDGLPLDSEKLLTDGVEPARDSSDACGGRRTNFSRQPEQDEVLRWVLE